jgi:hypothetical protein
MLELYHSSVIKPTSKKCPVPHSAVSFDDLKCFDNPAAMVPRKLWRIDMRAFVRPSQFAAVFAAVSFLATANVALAGMPCGSHDKIAKSLSDKFKEARRIMGVVNPEAVMEIFMSQQGTWTVLMTNTKGMSCIIAAGEAWQELPVKVAGIDS